MATERLLMRKAKEILRTKLELGYSNQAELKALATSVATRSPQQAGAAAAALLVKLVSGSSLTASAVEAAVTGPLGQFLADTPNKRFSEAARALDAEDARREALDTFARVVAERIRDLDS